MDSLQKALTRITAEDEVEDSKKSQEDLLELVLEHKDEQGYWNWDVKEAMRSLDEDSLKKIVENKELKDGFVNTILNEFDKRHLSDFDYWSKYVLDRINNYDSDELGKKVWEALGWHGEIPEDLLEKVVMTEDSYDLRFDTKLPDALALKVLKEGKNEDAVEKALETFRDDKNTIMTFLIDRIDEPAFKDLGPGYTLRDLSRMDDMEDIDWVKLAENIKREDFVNSVFNNYITDTNIIKNYIKKFKGDKSDFHKAIDRLIDDEDFDDSEFFTGLAKDPKVLESNPGVLTKFEDEELFKEILKNEELDSDVKDKAALGVHDEDFIMKYLKAATERREYSKTFKNLVSNIKDEDLLKDLIKTNLKDLREHALSTLDKETNQDYLKEIINDNKFDADDLRTAVDNLEKGNDDYLSSIITDSKYHPDVQRRASLYIKDEDILEKLARDESVLYDIRRDILLNDEDLAEKLELDPDDFEEDKLIERLESEDTDMSEKMLLIRSIEDVDALGDVFEQEAKEASSELWKYLVTKIMPEDFSDFFEKINKNKDAIESVIELIEDDDLLREIIEDDLIASDLDYYEKGGLGQDILNKIDYDDSLVYTALTNGLIGEDENEWVSNISDQDVLKDIIYNDSVGSTAQEAAVDQITDQDVLKEVMGWSDYFPDRAYSGIKDAEWLKDWVLEGNEMPESDSEERLIEHINDLDDENKYIKEIYLWAVEENSDYSPIALQYIKDQKLLEEAIDSESAKIRKSALINYKDEEVLEDKALNDPDPGVREVAVKNLKGDKHQDLLKKVALNDENATVRLQAVDNITDDEFIRERVYNEKDDDVAMKALEKLKGDKNAIFLMDLYFKSPSEKIREQCLENIPAKGNQEFFKKAALTESEEDNARILVSKLEDDKDLFDIATHKKPIKETRKYAIRKLEDQERLTKIATMIGDRDLKGEAIIKLDGDHLKPKWIDIWWGAYQQYDEPHRVPVSSKLKAVKSFAKNNEDGKYEEIIQKILKTIPYRHLPEEYRPLKRDISFEKPGLKDKDIGLHIPKANVQLFRLLLTMAR